MTNKNKNVYDRLNITKWQDLGYTGKDVLVAIIGFEKGAHHNGASIIKEVAPGCEIVELNVMKGGMSFEAAFQECLDMGADVVCCSLRKGNWNSELQRLSKELRDSGCIMLDSADNEGKEIDAYPAMDPSWIAIGAYDRFVDGKANYSSYGSKMLGLCYEGLDSLTKSGTYIPLTHTSGAVQVPAGMAALLKESHRITPEGFKEFIKENSMDILNNGKDEKSGWGVLMMPEMVYQNEIKLTIGKDTMEVNGETKPIDTAPFIKDSRTFVPVRFIAEALGAKIEWDEATQQVIIKK